MARKVLLLFICCLLLLPAGCNAPVKVGDAGDKPWDLFTQEEAEAILGFEVEPEIQKIDSMGQKIVFYGPVSDKETSFIQVSIVRNEEMEDSLKEQGYSVKQFFEETKKALPESPQTVKGFGDEAFWTSGALHILAGDVFVTVSTSHSDTPEALDRAKEVAGIVLDRL